MNNPNHLSFPQTRRAALATVVAMLAASALAQSSSSTTPSDTTRRSSQPASATPGAPYQSTAPADVDSTRDVNPARNATMSRDKLSWGDRRFVTKTADGGQAEVQMAQLAAQRATNPEVRSFAQKLVDDHTKVNAELLSLASQKGVKVDTDDDKDRSYKRLNKKSGAEFDQEFVEHMIDEHEKEIKVFEKASTDAKDSDVRSFAAKHVADLRGHLQQAQSLRQTIMPTGRVDSTSGRTSPDITPQAGPASTTSGTRTDSTSGSTGTKKYGTR